MEKFLRFPENFWWGAASSGPQTEGWAGKRHENVMDFWYRTRMKDFFYGVGPNVASDFYHKYPEDFKLMKEIGLNTFRTSIQWSRLIKDLETGEPDPEAAAWYKSMFQTARDNGIELVISLHHADLPAQLLTQYGGWQSRHVVDLYEKFARTAFSLFGKDIKWWITFSEPMGIPESGYLYGQHYPRLQGKGKEAVQIMYNLNLASAKAIQAYRDMHLEGHIGIILNVTPAYPKSQEPEDVNAAEFADLFFNRSFLDPAVHGRFPGKLEAVFALDGVLPALDKEERMLIKNHTVDYLGINYYHPRRIQAPLDIPPCQKWMPERYFSEYQWPKARMNPYRGWEIYPPALLDIARMIRDDYGNIPWFVSENGMGVEGEERYRQADNSLDDDYRIDFYKEHLVWLYKGIQEGSSCFGFHPWTATDCWSWNNAYKNRYGLISVNLGDQSRSLKKSAWWYKEVIERNGFETD